MEMTDYVQEFLQSVSQNMGASSTLTVWLFFAVILTFFVAWFFFDRVYRKKMGQQNDWLTLLNLAYRKGLSNQQIDVLHTFFFGLDPDTSKKVAGNPSQMKDRLMVYLKDVKDISNELKVRLMDRLFLPGIDAAGNVEKVTDLKPGEACGIEVKGEQMMGTVMETKENDMLVCIPGMGHLQDVEGKESKVYAYRPDIGGFLFSGILLSSRKECLYFRHTGELESKIYFHLMVQKELPLKFHSWPVVDEAKAEVPVSTGSGKEVIPVAKKNVVIYGQTYKISDRALSFHFKTDQDRVHFEGNEQIIWEMTMLMEDGSHVTCRGKIMNLDANAAKSGIHHFKYIDMPEREMERLFKWIKENHPTREKLTI